MEDDLHHRVKGVIEISKRSITSNTTNNGNTIDTVGFESLEYFTTSGIITDGNYDFLLQEDDNPAFMNGTTPSTTTLAPDEILGSTIGFTVGDDDTVKRVGSVGKKRFQRLSIVSTGVSSGMDRITGVAVLSDAYVNPVADQ